MSFFFYQLAISFKAIFSFMSYPTVESSASFEQAGSFNKILFLAL